MRPSRDAVRSMRAAAAALSGMERSQRASCRRISASTKRVVRRSTGKPSEPATARRPASVANELSGVSSARMKEARVGVMAIRF